MIPFDRLARRWTAARSPSPLTIDESCILFGGAANDIWPFLDSWDKLEHWFRIRPGATSETILIGSGPATRDLRILSRHITREVWAMRSDLVTAGSAIDTFLSLRTVSARNRSGQLGLGTEVWVHAEFSPGAGSLPSIARSVTHAGLRAMHAELST